MQCEKCGKKVYANELCSCGQKAPRLHNGAVRTNSVICFILVMIASLCLILTLSLRTIVNKELLIKSVEDVKLAEIEVDGKKLDQYIYDEYVDDERITVENVDNLLEDSFIKDFIIDKINAYQNFALDDGDMPFVTADDIVKLIEDNEDLLYNEAGLRFLDPDKEELRNNLSALDKFEDFSNDHLDTWFGTALFQTFFSQANVIFLVVLLDVIFIQWLVVYKLNARRASKMLIKYGIAAAIPSVIVLVATILLKVLPDLDTADKIAGSAKTPVFIYSIVMLVAGVAITVIGSAFNRKYKTSLLEVGEVKTIPDNVVPDDPVITAPTDNVVETVGNVCPQCSHVNKENASFCSRCGTKLN